MRTILLAVTLSLAVSGCSSVRDSRANPFNWFGNDDPAPQTVATENDNPLIPDSNNLLSSSSEREVAYAGAPIQAITDVTLERVPGGVMIRATGLSLTQGAYDVRLVPAGDSETPQDGVLAYRLEALNNADITVQGPPETRTVTVARTLTDQELAGTRVVRVSGVQNTVDVRR